MDAAAICARERDGAGFSVMSGLQGLEIKTSLWTFSAPVPVLPTLQML